MKTDRRLIQAIAVISVATLVWLLLTTGLIVSTLEPPQLALVAEQLMRVHEGLQPDVDWKTYSQAAMEWLQIGEDEIAAWQEELSDLLAEV